MSNPLHKTVSSMALALPLLLLAACGTKVVNPVTGQSERSAMSEQAEIAAGAKNHEAVLQEYSVLNNPGLQAYVNNIGQRLASHSHRSQLKWTFTVLDSPEVNAFALPGGYVYVTRGIMAYLDSEAELAGVIGHEIGHVTARHGAQRATRQQNAGLGAMAATVLGLVLETKGVGGATQAASQAAQQAAAGYVASYSREQESQADRLGAEYLARNGYNPANMVDVIAVLKRQELFAADAARAQGRAPAAPGSTNYLSSHPSNDQRLADITQVAAGYKGQYSDDARTRYLKAIEGMPYGSSREQGVVRGAHFFHEGLGIAITAPPGFEIRNTPEAVMVVAASGEAGLIMRLVPPNAGSTHDDIIRNVVKPTEGRVERRNINGMPVTDFAGARRDAQGQVQNLRVAVATGPGNNNYLLQHASRDANAARRYAQGLEQAEASLRPLSPGERRAAQPYSVRLIKFPLGGFAELARTTGQSEAQLRLLNGVYGSAGLMPAMQDPAPGSVVKVVAQ
jgi:predicted Zn-dependent protease